MFEFNVKMKRVRKMLVKPKNEYALPFVRFNRDFLAKVLRYVF